MNTDIVKTLITDLREKRLWPVAVALLVALIAVPVLLSTSSKPAPVAPLPAVGSASASVPALPAVSVTTTPSNARLTGPERNPFTQQGAKGAGTTTGASTGAAASSSGSGATGSSGSSGTTGSSGAAPPAVSGTGISSGTPVSSSSSKKTSTTTTKKKTPTPAVTKYAYYDVNVVYARVDSVPKSLDNLERLDPLPHASNPMIVFLGVASDGKSAVFLVSRGVHVTGNGTCSPSRATCEFLKMKAGEADLFKTVRAGIIDQFSLSLTSVNTKSTTSASVAAAARARQSETGSKIVTRALGRSTALRTVKYSKQTGTVSLHITHRSVEHLLRTMRTEALLEAILQPLPAAS